MASMTKIAGSGSESGSTSQKILNFFKLLIDEKKREKACFLHGWLVLYEPLLHLCIQGEEAQTLRSPTPKSKFLLPSYVPYSEAVFRIRIRKVLGSRIRTLPSTSKTIPSVWGVTSSVF
jgi:hypothetical protein